MRSKIIVLMASLLLSGCAGQWVKVSSKEPWHQADGYRVQLPGDWVKIQQADSLLVTRDGPGLQRIIIRMAPHDDAFRLLKKASSAKQLPSELADLYIANLRKQDADEMPSLEILSNAPAQVAGHEAFRIHASYRTGSGLRNQIIAYGFVTEKHFVSISYTAPTLHYFERDEGTIEGIVSSLKLL